ncbi:MAG: undecaprenyl-phosphate galactose phosphotransferase WbaP [Granulosicoccus sp.]
MNTPVKQDPLKHGVALLDDKQSKKLRGQQHLRRASDQMTHGNDAQVLDFWPRRQSGDAEPSANVRAVNRIWQRWALIIADILALSMATIGAVLVSEGARTMLQMPTAHYGLPGSPMIQIVMLLLPVVVLIWSGYVMGHYTRLKPLWSETKDLVKIMGYSIALVAVVLFLSNAHFSRIFFIAYWSFILLLVPTCRFLAKSTLIRAGKFFVPVVIFGNGSNAARSARTIESDRMLGLKIVAFIDLATNLLQTNTDNEQIAVSNLSRINRLKLDEQFDHPHYVFALESAEDFETNRQLINSMISSCRFVTVSAPVYGLPLDGAEVLNVQPCDSLLVRLQNKLVKPHNVIVKRVVDVVGSSIALLLFSPIMLALLVFIKRDGGPVFYGQERIGRHGKTFKCWKFRSMVHKADTVLEEYLEKHPELRQAWKEDHKLKNDPRVTFLGKYIRKGSIDELPQLWNVLRGDMSLVGPRPIVKAERIRYGELFDYYLSVRPGITGLWQISGRNDTTYKERVDLDVWYSRNWSLWLDIVITLRTIPAVLFRSGAY